jgi:hypothetical protein
MDKKPTKESPLAIAAACSSLKRKRPPMIEIPNVLQEIHTVNSRTSTKPRFQELTPRNTALSFSGNGVGVSAIKGKKKFMEDTHKIVSCLHGNSNQVILSLTTGFSRLSNLIFIYSFSDFCFWVM